MSFNTSQNKYPKYMIQGPSGFVADVSSSGTLLTGGGAGVATISMGSKIMIAGPSGFVADVDSNGNLKTH